MAETSFTSLLADWEKLVRALSLPPADQGPAGPDAGSGQPNHQPPAPARPAA